MNFYKNHVGMIIASIVALCLSLMMATAAIFVDHLAFTVPLWIKNWGTAFLTISITGMILPMTDWAFALGRRLHLTPNTLPHILLENFVATFFFNTAACLVLAAVNIFANESIAAAVAAGAAPSVSAIFWSTFLRDWPIMFVLAFIFAFIVTKIAVKIAGKIVGELETETSPQRQPH
ncbi:hypothetical protein NE619_09980 [Anaerovorax odorimutans]|uniref:DUF2798 domain-containing protein n=1 Tax=Anaerovorax odorimutans TaxID=109327 RepID=A0ABT1RPC9_9FIRM|nr:hypothetical protein [Anaerovorax odorimutans]MCQ4637054.1 hypothetical protein [Anaerovorax odorimutans]